MEASPVNTLLHQWHFDTDFSDGAGTAKTLTFEGPLSFSTLVSRHAGDIPAGAMRSALQKAGVLTQDSDGLLSVSQSFFYSRVFDQDFIRRLAFSLNNLGSTLVHNAAVHQRTDISNDRKRELGRLERAAWSEHLDEEGIAKFKAWVDDAAPRFLRESNRFIGENELPRGVWNIKRPRSVGVSVYYFEED
jgi:hypothetical protein